MAMADVTVLGAGIFGLAVGWECARRGARVRVIDPAGPGAGASGGLVGALAPHAPEAWTETKEFQLEALLKAGAWWQAVADAAGLDPGFARCGRIQPVSDEAAVERARARSAEAARRWRPSARWDVVAAERFADWAPAAPTGLVVHDTLSGRVHPRRALAALAAAIRAEGGEVVQDGMASGAIVECTGWQGLVALSQRLGREVGGGEKGQAALLACAAEGMPLVQGPGLFIVPHSDATVAIGSTAERNFADPTGTDERLEAVIERARELLPRLRDAPVLERWAGVRPRTASRRPVLGRHPLIPGRFIANGGFKIGFGIAPRVAEVMADLVLQGRDAIPAAFRPPS